MTAMGWKPDGQVLDFLLEKTGSWKRWVGAQQGFQHLAEGPGIYDKPVEGPIDPADVAIISSLSSGSRFAQRHRPP